MKAVDVGVMVKKASIEGMGRVNAVSALAAATAVSNKTPHACERR